MKLFVWDFHGTLEKNNEAAVIQISNKVLENFGYKERLTKEDNIKLYGKKWYEYFEYLLPQETPDTHFFIQQKCIEYEIKHPKIIGKYIKPNNYAYDVLKEVSKDHEQILVSNMSNIGLTSFLKAVKMTRYFPKGKAFATNSHRKQINTTKKEVLTKYLKNKKFDKVVTIGDTKFDVEMGKAVGAITYLYVHPNKKFDNVNADYKINDLREVLKEI